MQEILRQVAHKSLKGRVPDCRPGDTVRVMVKVKEGSGKDERSRLQAFEGVVIARTGGGINESIKVRRVTHGIGIERIFPLHSPTVDDVITVRHGKVRRAKLYYLRERTGRQARVREQERDVVIAREEAERQRVEAEAEQQPADEANEQAAAEPDSEDPAEVDSDTEPTSGGDES